MPKKISGNQNIGNIAKQNIQVEQKKPKGLFSGRTIASETGAIPRKKAAVEASSVPGELRSVSRKSLSVFDWIKDLLGFNNADTKNNNRAGLKNLSDYIQKNNIKITPDLASTLAKAMDKGSRLNNKTLNALAKLIEKYENLRADFNAQVMGLNNAEASAVGQAFKAFFKKDSDITPHALAIVRSFIESSGFPGLITASTNLNEFQFNFDGKFEVITVNSLEDLHKVEEKLNKFVDLQQKSPLQTAEQREQQEIKKRFGAAMKMPMPAPITETTFSKPQVEEVQKTFTSSVPQPHEKIEDEEAFMADINKLLNAIKPAVAETVVNSRQGKRPLPPLPKKPVKAKVIPAGEGNLLDQIKKGVPLLKKVQVNNKPVTPQEENTINEKLAEIAENAVNKIAREEIEISDEVNDDEWGD